VPVVLAVQESRDDFGHAVAGLAAKLGMPFILVAPTNHLMDARGLEILKGARGQCFDMESLVLLLPSGAVQAKQNPMEVFAAFLPGSSGPAPEDVARQVFATLEKLDSQGDWRKAAPSKVLRLYYGKGLSRREVAKRCGCVAGLITLRLQQIEGALKMTRAELLGLSSHLQRIEDSLSDSRARSIYRKGAAYGDSPDDGQEE